MTEQWSKWEPVPGLSANYYMESILDTPDGFTIQFFDTNKEEKKVQVIFEYSVSAYKSTNESYRLNTMHKLDERYGKNFYHDWTFFKITNSSYIQWLSEESYGITDSLHFMHFAFLTPNSFLDVIARYEPEVILINAKDK